MGLSSAQGRLLMLTSRLSDIELQETMLSQRQNQLALDSMESANKYNQAMSNYKITLKIPDSSTLGYSKQDLTYSNLTSVGYLVTDGNNNLFLTASATDKKITLTEKDSDGNWVIPSGYNKNLLNIDDATGSATVLKWDVPKDASGKDLFTIKDGTATIGGVKYSLANGNKYLNDKKILQSSIMNSNLYLLNTNNTDDGKIDIEQIANNTDFEYILDTSDDAVAESEYQYETARVSNQSRMLDMEIKQLETEHEAVLKEIDSVKEVISNNIDRTFKLFSNG